MLHIYREFILKRLIYCLRHCINFVFYCYFVIPLRCQFLQHFDGWNFNFSTICAKSDGENEIYLDEISNTIFQKNMYFLFLVMIGKLIYQVIVLQYWIQNPQTRIFLGSVCTSYISETENNNKMEKAVVVILLATVKKAVIGYNWKQNREMRKELNLTCLV